MIQGIKTINIWLVRHGQTEGNKAQILQGQDGGELSNLGVNQADQLGKRLSKEKFELTYVSDLNRAMQTYEGIQKHHPKALNPKFDPLLREKHAGVLQGKSLAIPKQMAMQQKVDIRKFRPDEGESWEDVNQRSQQMLQKIIQESTQIPQNIVNVLIVSHGGFIMEFMNHINYMISKKPAVYNNNALNCAIYMIQYRKPTDIKIVIQNDAKHVTCK